MFSHPDDTYSRTACKSDSRFLTAFVKSSKHLHTQACRLFFCFVSSLMTLVNGLVVIHWLTLKARITQVVWETFKGLRIKTLKVSAVTSSFLLMQP